MSVIVIIFLSAIVSLYLGIFKAGKYSQHIAILGLLLALATTFLGEYPFFSRYSHMLNFDQTAKVFTQIAIFITILIFLLGNYALKLIDHHQSEIYCLLMFVLCGGIVLFSYQNLITLFLGIEILSIPLYVLAGSNKHDLRSNEASVKYFLLGAFATGFLLFGIALIYGVTNSFSIDVIRQYSINTTDYPSIYMTGIILLLIGLLFKISVAPFHFWAPDVYEGSPSVITAFMSSVVKISGFVALFKLMEYVFVGQLNEWQYIVFYVAIITLLTANIVGILQNNVKRMLAYSSISHAGYLLLIYFNTGIESVYTLAFYLLAYSLATVGAFASIIYIERITNGITDIKAFNGLAKTQPILAISTTVSLLSMAGIPLTSGFIAKFMLFNQAIKTQPLLVIIAILGSAISIAYYLKLIIAMYFKPSHDEIINAKNPPLIYNILAIFIFILIIVLGIYPQPVFTCLAFIK
ncbi:NADH-quinone oxidoreductase subunit N [Apibacter muscae]|uniref:NADH-quinone oxidoreductase subunit N n=1 Tax=Apibacter muscae TaxID=2509004 RepID=A0A563DB48_9FLAO|nr:NADH-quinone oxidoreductase subunit N [Apibacter muscae]TWP27446.1 NADH-quinone oxidoreductase subunit N [Apibacter muscae]TWP28862.1 NADH-quinone oxidoreductase subunit N [Apibacter muscae]